MKIFLDTNVLVGAVFSPTGVCFKVIEKVYEEHTIVISVEVLNELGDVLKRKTTLTDQEIAKVIYRHGKLGLVTQKQKKHAVAVRDPDDQIILERVLGEGAEILITGDKDLLDIRAEVKALKIVSPKAFLHTF